MKKPLILWGGTDIDSKYYNQPPSKYNQYPNKQRDSKEYSQLVEAINDKLPSIGVCRGMQLQCIANRGVLYQHSVPTSQNHKVIALVPPLTESILLQNTPSAHHQICKPSGDSDYDVLAWDVGITKVWDYSSGKEEIYTIYNSIEAIWYPETLCLGFQGHPEWAAKDSPYLKWVNDTIKYFGIDYEF